MCELTAIKDLALGDVVKLAFEPYGNATVYKINANGTAQVWRPYVSTSGVEYSGCTIPYIGIEDFTLAGPPIEVIQHNPCK